MDRKDFIYTVTRLRTPRQTSLREDRHIIRHARVEPTASLTTVQSQAAPSVRTCVFPNLHKAPGCRTSGIAVPITCAANAIHPPTPPRGLV
ncbi:hypothetical protein TNCV_3645081 [Trichonephila clavipes]|nr:hypothetical protein TNCV_3645081 [Trichonephila clavipes]